MIAYCGDRIPSGWSVLTKLNGLRIWWQELRCVRSVAETKKIDRALACCVCSAREESAETIDVDVAGKRIESPGEIDPAGEARGTRGDLEEERFGSERRQSSRPSKEVEIASSKQLRCGPQLARIDLFGKPGLHADHFAAKTFG